MNDAFEALYRQALQAAQAGRRDEARDFYRQLLAESELPRRLQALAANDLAVLAAVGGDEAEARRLLVRAEEADAGCETVRANRSLLEEGQPAGVIKVAIVSFLFNWPSRGGGIIHTVELARFLAEAGYRVKLFCPRFAPWGIGRLEESCPVDPEILPFEESDWNLATIRRRFREAVDAFGPDFVILTDSWNIKPHLAEAMRGYRYLLRMQAQECLCPLNNLRLLPEAGGLRQCLTDQLSDPAACRQCLQRRGDRSGGLHRLERAFSGVSDPDYPDRLRRALREAHAVLALNGETAELLRAEARNVRVVTWGMDPRRFPPPAEEHSEEEQQSAQIFFAGQVEERIKGFSVLQAACRRLWRKRSDFELVATGEPAGPAGAFTQYTGWLSQTQLPASYRQASFVVVPSLAREGLSRTAVEAMAAGRAVLGSRIGGLPELIEDGVTGLLCSPGDPDELAAKIEQLLDDPALRRRMGRAGRQRFERDFTWPAVIERHYRPLLALEAGCQQSPTRSAGESVAGSRSVGSPPSRVGCVLAIHNRPAEVLERTLQTYAYQSLEPAERVLVDYGSDEWLHSLYARLCGEYGWRLIRAEPADGRWQLSAAYNLAVSVLSEPVEVVFKSDVDVLLGAGVLELAAEYGGEAFCRFAHFTTAHWSTYPQHIDSEDRLREILAELPPKGPSVGDGLFACPRRWFREVGGFDLAYRQWGYEDHDLRCRAEGHLPVREVGCREALLVHQWHPPGRQAAEANRSYFEAMRQAGSAVRNEGRLLPADLPWRECPVAGGEDAVPQGRRPNILVLGVGHSGTTVLTRMLFALGWQPGRADETYAEDVDVRRLNEEALRTGRLPQEAGGLLAELAEPWAVKDPRLVRTLHLWQPIFWERDSWPLLLWVTRNLAEVAQSYRARGEYVSAGPGAHGATVEGLWHCAREQFAGWPGPKWRLDYEPLRQAAGLFRRQTDLRR